MAFSPFLSLVSTLQCLCTAAREENRSSARERGRKSEREQRAELFSFSIEEAIDENKKKKARPFKKTLSLLRALSSTLPNFSTLNAQGTK